MKKKISYEERTKRNFLKDVKMLRIPSRTDRPKPILKICAICKRNRVTDHHFLCNSCHRAKQLKEMGRNNGKYKDR